MIRTQSNWGGNFTYSAARLHHPETVEAVQEIVSRARKVKALGSRHSFSLIADSTGDLVSLERLQRLFLLDREEQTVTIDGGAKYGQLCEQLNRAGFALPNMASLPHIAVAGACATATHGSGESNGSLATAVRAIELVTAEGELAHLSRDQYAGADDPFSGVVVGLGALGIVTKLTLDVIPAFNMRQDVYENLPLKQLEEHFDEISSSAYSVSILTRWQDETVDQVWLKRPVANEPVPELEPTFFGAARATRPRHPIPGISAEACTEQLGVPGPWNERLPHFRMGFTPSNGEELQSEYLVPRLQATAAFRALSALRDPLARLLQISEIRTVAADDHWMSPFYQRDSVAFHFTWKKDWNAVRELLPLIEEQLAPLSARPHWGKLFTMPPREVQLLYPRLADFQRLLLRYDPQGKFHNSFLDRYILGEY